MNVVTITNKMYEIELPNTVHQLLGILYRSRMWSDSKVPTFGGECWKFFYFIYFVAFVSSIAVGAITTDDKDECVYLAVLSVMLGVQTYRMAIILWRKKELILLVHQIGEHSTSDREEILRINNYLNILMTSIRYFWNALKITCLLGGVVFPITTQHLMFNIAFPFDRNNSDIAFWMAAAFVLGGCWCSALCVILTMMIWFLMASLSFEYKILGAQLRNMGTNKISSPDLRVSFTAQQQAFFTDVILAIKTYGKVNGVLEVFASFFAKLFFMQVATGSVCICGSVYTLAFSSHANLITDGFYCLMLAYSFFDIFVVMYFGNEIKLSSDQLSYCAYESNWIEQTQSGKKCVIIFTERLRQPQELIVGKLYPLNLLTFNRIVNGAYSLLNILQNVR